MTTPTAPDPTSFLPLTNLAFHTLVALAEEDRHGYAIIKDIEDRTEGQLAVRSGALYTVIQRLLEAGLVDHAPLPDERGARDTRRKYYRITPLGREVAAAEGVRLSRMVEAASRRHLLPERETR
jgi:DNA-binding PadR family transcriptional regulator